MSNNVFCLACGCPTPAGNEFCKDQCRDHGVRRCGHCQTLLHRRSNESTQRFRRRRYCGPDCLSQGLSDVRRQSWNDPDLRERMLRGMRLASTPDRALVSRDQMLRNWQTPAIVRAILAKRPRTGAIAADVVRAIRADSRSSAVVAKETGVSRSEIGRIRRRQTYQDVT